MLKRTTAAELKVIRMDKPSAATAAIATAAVPMWVVLVKMDSHLASAAAGK
jgi:hypothetical protein